MCGHRSAAAGSRNPSCSRWSAIWPFIAGGDEKIRLHLVKGQDHGTQGLGGVNDQNCPHCAAGFADFRKIDAGAVGPMAGRYGDDFNAAEDLSRQAPHRFRILEKACGSALPWPAFPANASQQPVRHFPQLRRVIGTVEIGGVFGNVEEVPLGRDDGHIDPLL